MIHIFISVLVFILVTIIHVIVHRVCVLTGRKTFKSVAVYLLGLISLVILPFLNIIGNLFPSVYSLPLTGIVFYSLISILYIMFFTSTYSQDVSPSIQLFLHIKQSPGISHHKLLRYFSEYELIDRRMHNLVQNGYIRKSSNKFYISNSGQTLIRLIDGYRHLLRWESSG